MGKSKRFRRADDRSLREYQRQRKLMLIITLVIAVLFVASVAFRELLGSRGMTVIFIMLFLYTASYFVLRQSSKCPYCEKVIVPWHFGRESCPHCQRPLRPRDKTRK